MTQNKYVLNWIKEMSDLVNPDNTVWIDGSEEQTEALRAQACKTGELIALNSEEYPNCYLHRTAVNDVARVENRTFICTREKADAGSVILWPETGNTGHRPILSAVWPSTHRRFPSFTPGQGR